MTKKKEKKAGKHMRKSELAEQLMTWMQMRPGEDFSIKQIFRGLNLTTHPLKMLCMDILHEMAEDDFLQVMDNGHLKLNNHGIILTGKFQRKSNGKNTFVPEDGSEPIFIAERNSGHAMHGDKVKVYTIGVFSKEICGGPHVERTGGMGTFRIKKEEASSAGVRRIKAVLE